MKENEIVKFKQQCDCDDIQDVEFEIVSCENDNNFFREELEYIDSRLDNRLQEIDRLNKEIDRLTNKADGLDYAIAVSSGILCGLIDSFFVGEFSLDRGRDWADDKINNFVKKIGGGDTLEKSVQNLEKKYGFLGDSVTNDFGGGRQHHLRDFSHHPNAIGLLFSMLTQFTSKVYGTDTNGFFQIVNVPEESKALIGKNFPSKITLGFVHWIFHMISDMAGSSGSIAGGKRGTGLPGPFVSFLKMLSALPIFKNVNSQGYKEFSVWISKLFNGTLLAERDSNGKLIKETVKNFDLRAEIGVGFEIGRQAIPVIINECVVRGAYFVRRFSQEIKSKSISSVYDFKYKIDWENVLPWKNRTIVRMLTIAHGTFVAVDMADAAIRASLSTDPASFGVQFLLRVNFVGVGRFVVALGTDIAMGIQRRARRMERINCYNEVIHLYNAKVFYLEGNMWKQLEATNESLTQLDNAINNSMKALVGTIGRIDADVENIKDVIKRNKELQKFVDNLI